MSRSYRRKEAEMRKAFSVIETLTVLAILVILGLILFVNWPLVPTPTPPDTKIIVEKYGEKWEGVQVGDILINRHTDHVYFFLSFENNDSLQVWSFNNRHAVADPILPISDRLFDFRIIPRGDPKSPNPEWLQALDERFRRFVPDQPRDK